MIGIILSIFVFILFIVISIIIASNIIACIILPTQRCPRDNTAMSMLICNPYTGVVIYRCPKCRNYIQYHFSEEGEDCECLTADDNLKSDKE